MPPVAADCKGRNAIVSKMQEIPTRTLPRVLWVTALPAAAALLDFGLQQDIIVRELNGDWGTGNKQHSNAVVAPHAIHFWYTDLAR
ncbi:hypothetical protein CIB48_g12018, partial [Xylaria polymorpha]